MMQRIAPFCALFFVRLPSAFCYRSLLFLEKEPVIDVKFINCRQFSNFISNSRYLFSFFMFLISVYYSFL